MKEQTDKENVLYFLSHTLQLFLSNVINVGVLWKLDRFYNIFLNEWFILIIEAILRQANCLIINRNGNILSSDER